ncbi:MAG: MBL fold metallo-hydrolase [Chitinophagaceae bacterium]|nr:MBL fold metallo-hydrolase [Chitinophagaceae bacterium]
MQRRSFLRNSGLTLAALALFNKESLAAFLNDPAWKIKMLTDDIGIFTEKGGTIAFYLSREGAVVVDSQFPDSVQHLIDELKKKSEKPFRLLINTHHHGDHTGGNIVFKDLVPHVLAHANSKINQQQSAIKQKTEDKQLYPDQTYTDTWCEKIGKEKICLHHFGAGHTNGDSFIHFTRANIVHVGDLVFNRRHPYVDKSAGADIASWIKVLDKAVKTFSKKTTFICGHACQGFDVLLKADDLKAFGEYLGNVLKFTEAGIKAGKTKEEILKATEIPGSPEWKGNGIERPLDAAYTELTVK